MKKHPAPQSLTRKARRSQRCRPLLEVLEDRRLLAVAPLTLADPSFWGASAAGVSGNASAFSNDGQLIAFESDAGNVTANDFNAVQDIFVRSVNGGTSVLVSATPGGASGNGASYKPQLSGDGRFVLFESDASDLVAGDNNKLRDVFIRDLQTGTTSLVSVNASLSGPANSGSFGAGISADGRLVAFRSTASNLVALPTGGVQNLFVRDMVTGTTTLVTANFTGTAAGNNDAAFSSVSFSPNNDFILFESRAGDLVTNDFNGIRQDIFIRNLQSGTTTLVSVNPEGVAGNNASTGPVLSPDGRFVAFSSKATDLVAGNPLPSQLYVRDLVANTTALVSVDNAFDGAAGIHAANPVFSPDGRYLAYEGEVTDLADLPTEIYARDFLNSTTLLVTANRFGGHLADGQSTSPVFSPDSQTVYFASTATTLVADPSDGVSQIYARNLQTNTTTLISRDQNGAPASSAATRPILAGNGQILSFQSQAAGLAANDNNALQDVFLLNTGTGAISLASARSTSLPAEYTSRTNAVDQRQTTAISDDGRYVVFTSDATDLTPNAVSGKNVYRYDQQTGLTELVSVNPDGTGGDSGLGASGSPMISADGRYVVFASLALNLVPGLQLDQNSTRGLFVRDMDLHATRAISVNAAGQLAGGSGDRFTISPNGRYVAFATSKPLLAADTNTRSDVYVYDLQLNSRRLASVGTGGLAGNLDSNVRAPTAVGEGHDIFSTDGRYLLFTSSATDLTTAGGVNEALYRRDLVNGVTDLVSVNAAGDPTTTFGHSISGDGTRVAFVTNAQLTPQDTNSQFDVYVYDFTAGTTSLVTGNEAFGGVAPSISRDGQLVLYTSNVFNNRLTLKTLATDATQSIATGSDVDYFANLSGDGRFVAYLDTTVAPNGLTSVSDLYLYDVQAQTATLVSANQAGSAPGNKGVLPARPMINASGAVVAFGSDSSDLIPSDINNRTDIFAFTRVAEQGTLRGEVFDDIDGNRVRNGGEGTRAGWMVFLDTNNNGTREPGEAEAFTDAQGQFAFNNLTPGSYRVAAEKRSGFTQTAPLAGNYSITLGPGQTVAGLEFGFQQSSADLAVQSIDLPTSGEPGQSITVGWTVTNLGAPALSAWQDAIYFSRDAVLDASAILLGTAAHVGGLAVGDSYAGGATVTLPATLPGNYYVLVQTDRRSQVNQAVRGNDVLASSTTISLTLPELTLDEPAAGQFAAPGDQRYYQITPPAGQSLEFFLHSAATAGATAIYVHRGALPTAGLFDVRGEAYQPDERATVPTTTADTYFVLVEGQYGDAAVSDFTLTASLPGLSLDSFSPKIFGNAGRATIFLGGAAFTADTTATLTLGATMLAASSIDFVDAAHLYATFDLTGVTPGKYDLTVSNTDGATASIAAAIDVFSGGGADLIPEVQLPPIFGAGRNGVFNVQVTNRGSNDSFVPVVWLVLPTGLEVSLNPDDARTAVPEVQLPLPELAGLPGVLPAGATLTVPVYYTAPNSTSGVPVEVTVELYQAPQDGLDPSGIQFQGPTIPHQIEEQDPSFISFDAYGAHFRVFGIPPVSTSSPEISRPLPPVPFQDQLQASFPDWNFQDTAPGSVQPVFDLGDFFVFRGSLKGIDYAGAALGSDNLEPWIQVVSGTSSNTKQVPNVIGVDPITGYAPTKNVDNLPFYWTAAITGNAATTGFFLDPAQFPTVLAATAAATSGKDPREFHWIFQAEVHPAEWDPNSATPKTVTISNDGVDWGYVMIVTMDDPVPVPWSKDMGNKYAASSGQTRAANDPNDISGPAGSGDAHFVTPTTTLPYTINFQNDPTKATAPAQEVVITQTLDASLDWNSFELGAFGFAPLTINVPAGLKSYQTQVDYHSPDGSPLRVDVDAHLDLQTGLVTWAFRSVDPNTGALPVDPLHGFLAIDDADHNGTGFVNFSVKPKAGLPTGTPIDAQASIVFDVNAPVLTNVFTNTIDDGAPTSSVLPLPAVASATTFDVSWSGVDDAQGSGIGGYQIYVSDNGGAFTLFQNSGDASATTAPFTGEAGHTYGLYSVAIDNVGNIEATPAIAEVTIFVPYPTTVSLQSSMPAGSVYGGDVVFTATATSASADTPTGSLQFIIDGNSFGGPVALTNGVATLTLNNLGAGDHAIGANFISDTATFFNGASTDLNQTVASAPLTVNSPSVANLSGTVFFDLNANATRDPGEPGLLGSRVFLDLNGDGTFEAGEPTAVTDVNGAYTFSGLAAGTYTVRPNFNFPNVIQTSPDNNTHTVALAGTNVSGVDFGEEPFAPAAPIHFNPELFVPHPNIDANTAFVQGLYHGVLGRTGEAAGVAVWLSRLTAGWSRAQVAEEFVNSLEYRNQQVDAYYHEFLGRGATDPLSHFWVDLLLRDKDEAVVIAGIMASPEYTAKHVGNADFVNDLYFRLLGRVGEDAGTLAWNDHLNHGDSRQNVVRDFLRARESADLAVTSFYAAYLHRAPDPVKAFWIDSLFSEALTYSQVQARFFASPEFSAMAASHTP